MPAELGPKPWTLDYTPNLNGDPDLPLYKLPGLDSSDNNLEYPESLWDPALLAGLAATEFAGQFNKWKNVDNQLTGELDWYRVPGTAVGNQLNFISGELDYLLALMADDRDRYMPEILAQADNAPVYWLQLLNLGGGDKPHTNALINFAQRAGEIAALYFKSKYKRVRPSALCPGLLLPFGPPRHPAFPSGHSLTGHLTTYILREITAVKNTVGKELLWLADRVAKNRERAGLHYPSDSAGGKKLAEEINKKLMLNTSVDYPILDAMLKAAKKEWA
jgi:hypothetical protein